MYNLFTGCDTARDYFVLKNCLEWIFVINGSTGAVCDNFVAVQLYWETLYYVNNFLHDVGSICRGFYVQAIETSVVQRREGE